MIDLHVHTHHSCDSQVSIDEYCRKAIELDLKYLCFTDHLDLNPADEGYGYYQAEEFFKEYNLARDKYADKINILAGLEFSEPHLYQKEFEKIQELPYDFILGSIHFWLDDMFPSELVEQGYPIEMVFEKYWEEVYQTVSYGGFDAFAHFDFPKRYFGECLWTEAQIKDIMSMMVKNNIALEINTSSLRKGLTESMPGKEIIKIYSDLGGVMITQGADTHSLRDLAAGYEYSRSLITGKLKSTVFINRQAEYLSIHN